MDDRGLARVEFFFCERRFSIVDLTDVGIFCKFYGCRISLHRKVSIFVGVAGPHLIQSSCSPSMVTFMSKKRLNP